DVPQIAASEAAQQPDQFVDFGGGPRPVLGAERKNGEKVDSEIASGTHGTAQRLDAAAMPFPARQPARGRPAPVAVHDDGNVPRHREIAALGSGPRPPL